MFAMGLGLDIDDFLRVAKFPKAFILGAVMQLISLPLIAFGIAEVSMMIFETTQASAAGHGEMSIPMREFAVGLMIIAACPGGITSNLLTYLGRGDAALSISLTAVLSVLSMFTVPFIVNFALNSYMPPEDQTDLSIGKSVLGVFFMTTVPVVIGMTIRRFKREFAENAQGFARKGTGIVFVLIVGLIFLRERELLMSSMSTVGSMSIALNLATMGLAFVVAKLATLPQPRVVAITFECGLQNGTLAVFICLTLLDNNKMVVPAAVYSALQFITAGFFLRYAQKTVAAAS